MQPSRPFSQRELGTARPDGGAGGSRPSSPAQMVPTKGHSEAELGSARPPLPPDPAAPPVRRKAAFQPKTAERKEPAPVGARCLPQRREAAGPRAQRAAVPIHTPAPWYFFPEGKTEDAFHKQTISAANFTITYGRLYD